MKNLNAHARWQIEVEQEWRKRWTLSKHAQRYAGHLNWTYPHCQYIIRKLEDAVQRAFDGESVRLIINLPPRHGKSTLVSQLLPSWVLTTRPWFKWILTTYGQNLANGFSRRIRALCEESGVSLKTGSQAVDHWHTAAGGGVRATGITGGVTGIGANGILIDDPIKNREEANSPLTSDRILAEFNDSFLTRLERINLVILIMTRWSEIDLQGRLLSGPTAHEWDIIRLPALAENNDPIGRKENEALCPELVPKERLEAMQKASPHTFEALYQQRPSTLDGEIFKREWIKYYDSPPSNMRCIQSIDTAFKTGNNNDYSACSTWGIAEDGYYLLDCWRERIDFPRLRDRIKASAKEWDPEAILIEDKASGQSLIQELRYNTRLPIIAILPVGDKVQRAHRSTPHFESGNIRLPLRAHWLSGFLAELHAFPNSAHDDQVDSLTQFICWHNGLKEDRLIIV